MSVKQLDHIGIIVSDLDQAIQQYQLVLGVTLDHIETYGEGLLKIAFLPLQGIQLELIQPLRPGSSAWDFLQEKGEGIEHLAFRVDEIETAWQRVLDQNIPATDRTPRVGAGQTRICFLKPEALCGVLGEFVSD